MPRTDRWPPMWRKSNAKFTAARRVSRRRKRLHQFGTPEGEDRELFLKKEELIIQAIDLAPSAYRLVDDNLFWGMIGIESKLTGVRLHFPKWKMRLLRVDEFKELSA